MTVTVRFDTMTEQQLWDIANPIMDNLMDASTHIATPSMSVILPSG